MSFELLDSILLESGIQTDKKEENLDNVVKESDNNIEMDSVILNLIETIDDTMYSDLDQLIEDSMRSSLRTTITESSIPSETKVEQLSIVEKAIFTKEQMTKFVNENVHPILDCAGVFNNTYNLGGDSPVAVSLPVYESALLLHIANEGLLESISEKDTEKTIKNSLYESLMNKEDNKSVEESMKIVNEHLSNLYDRYNIEEDSDREALFNEAIHVINKYGVDNLRPSFYELAECVCSYNKNAEENSEPLFGEMTQDVELSESENVFIQASKRMNAKLNGLITESVKNRFNNVSESTSFPEDSSIISIADTATGISAMVQWREDKSQCENYECLERAFREAVNTIKAQANTCKTTGNEKLCEACNKKLEDKWEMKSRSLEEVSAKVIKKAVGAVSGAVGGAIGGNLGSRLNKEYKKMKSDLADLKDKKAKAKKDSDKDKIQKQIEAKIKEMKKFRMKNTAVGAAAGGVAGGVMS